MIRLVACDMAGTTVDEHGDVYRALAESVKTTGATVDPVDLQAWMGADKREAITALARIGGVEAGDELVDRTFATFLDLLLGYYRERTPVALPGVEGAFRALRADGVRVALTTGFSRDVTDVLLELLGWSVGPAEEGGTIDALVTSDEVALGRPAPFMIHRAMERTGVLDVREVVAAGDTVNDLLAARHAGVVGVGVLTGELGRAELAAHPHDGILESVAELPAFVADR